MESQIAKIRRAAWGISAALSLIFGGSGALYAAPSFLEPGTTYSSFADSPFAALDFSGGYFHLEDFEDVALDTPGVASTSGGFAIGASRFTDSVDGDDGVIDGSGADGGSFFSGNPGGTPTFTFEFDASALGALPTHIGLVWTDVGFATPTNQFGEVAFEAFDSIGNSVGSIGPSSVGDGFVGGETAEDRFFGVIFAGGVSRIEMSMAGSSDDWEVDHLQYGRLTPVPAPAALILFLSGLLSLAVPKKRRT